MSAVPISAAPKLELSDDASDYFPAKISGTNVVTDPRSKGTPLTTPTCMLPTGLEGIVPLVTSRESITQQVIGGPYDCPPGAPDQSGISTGQVVGLEAARVVASTPKLTRKNLIALDKAAAVKARVVKINGVPVQGFVYVFTLTEASPNGAPAGTKFEIASAEPRSHLFVSTLTPQGGNPLRYLVAMLKAGAGRTPRAI